MTFEDALKIACSELQGNVDYLKDIYGENEPNIQDECQRLLTARNVLKKELDGAAQAWKDAELCGYNRGREHNETDLEVIRNAGIQEGIERMQKAYQIRPRGKSMLANLPEGYVLVPVEPTEKMLEAGEELEYFEGGYGSTCDEFYRAMIQAAQEEE